MTLRLLPIALDIDRDGLAAELAPGFGGDPVSAREMIDANISLMTSIPRPDPWGAYVAWNGERAVGMCAFKTAPQDDGSVEIAYMTFPAFERQGHATAMAAALFEIAREGGATIVVAHTLPEENASVRALRRNGFVHAGNVIDPEDGPVWRWERVSRS